MRASKLKIDNIYTDEYGIKPKGRILVPTAEQDVEYVNIKGRHGSLSKKYGYKDIPLPIHFTMHDENFKPIFRKAKPFLLSAKTLVFDDDNAVFYKVKSVRIDPAENVMKTFGEFTVYFVLDPFQYEIENDPITITKETTIENDGHTAQPIITVQVAGTGKIYIGEQEVAIKDVNGTITIDSEMQNAYRGGYPPQNMNNRMVGQFPVLEHGSNIISFDGDITELEIICNRRWV